ncbi:hypothetical protein HN51_027802 [Arachis hypogaea]
MSLAVAVAAKWRRLWMKLWLEKEQNWEKVKKNPDYFMNHKVALMNCKSNTDYYTKSYPHVSKTQTSKIVLFYLKSVAMIFFDDGDEKGCKVRGDEVNVCGGSGGSKVEEVMDEIMVGEGTKLGEGEEEF